MKTTISEILSQHIKKNSTLILAFSGGPDSVFLLDKIVKFQKKLPFRVILAHFNHKLRSNESDLDEKFSKKTAKKHDLDFEVASCKVDAYAKKHGLSIEEAARKKRYEFLNNIRVKYCADFIVTAHHLDDNLETFLLNFIRGAGVRGLKGMQIKNNNILRPLLYINKKEILEYLKKHKLKYRIDKSNKDTQFTRNDLRINVIPKLEKMQPKLNEVFLRNWEHLSELFDYMDLNGKEWISKHQINEFEMPLKEFLKLHPAFQKNILQNIYKRLHGDTQGLSTNMLNRAKKLISGKNTGKKVPFGKNTYLNITSGSFKCIPRKEPKKITKKMIKIPGTTPYYYGKVETSLLTKAPKSLGKAIFLDYSKIKQPLYIRSKKNGDKFQPLGMKGSKKLQDFFVDKKIPAHIRNTIPVITDSNDQIVGIGNDAIANTYRISSKTRKFLKIRFCIEKKIK
jgi:tRNA(Ile)-lysidine synthase